MIFSADPLRQKAASLRSWNFRDEGATRDCIRASRLEPL